MEYRRGFKTEANYYSREMRQEIGLAPSDPLCPWTLADHLGYIVKKLSEFENSQASAVAYFKSAVGEKEFSAITLNDGNSSLIIHNDFHHRFRQAANIAHELAHGLLLHKPAPLKDSDGARLFSKEQEDEANWLGPALLISEEAALHIVKLQIPAIMACNTYQVSKDLLNMRLNVTGAKKRAVLRSKAA